MYEGLLSFGTKMSEKKYKDKEFINYSIFSIVKIK